MNTSPQKHVGNGFTFSRRIRVIALLGLAVFPLTFFAWSRWTRPLAIPALGAQTETIVPRVHMIRGLGPSVAYVLESSAGPVLIDSGLEADAATLKSEMAKLLLDWRSIQAVLITHVHGDHCGGAEHLRETTRCKIYAGQGDAEVLRAGGPKESFFSAFHMPNHTPHKTNVDIELRGGEKLVFGDLSIEAISTPGHTPGSTCYLVETAGKRLLFSGDVIMHLGAEKPLGTYSAYLAPKYRGDAKTYLASLKALKAMKPPDVILPGHPPLGPKFDHPGVTPARWTSMMDEGIEDMRVLMARYEKDGSNFLDGTAKQLLPGLFYLGELDQMPVYAIVHEGRVILIDAPGTDELTKFVSDRFKSLNVAAGKPAQVWLTSCVGVRTKGLKALVERTSAEVVASSVDLEMLKKRLPSSSTLKAAEDLDASAPFGARAIVLKGDPAPAAYVLKIAGKTVLISGTIPTKYGEEAMAELASAPMGSRDDVVDELASIALVEPVKPDLWLPAKPWHGQNANLYDHEWADVIDTNYQIDYLKLRKTNATAKSVGLPAS